MKTKSKKQSEISVYQAIFINGIDELINCLILSINGINK
jgi:hypothetical protein